MALLLNIRYQLNVNRIVDEHERFFISSSHSTTIKTKSSISASLLKHKWNKNHPKIPKEFPIPNNIKPSLIITLFIGDLLIDNAFIKVLITSTSDQYLRIYDFEDNELIVETKILHSSAIRVINIIEKKYIITGGLDGQLILSKINTQKNGFNLKPIILKINKIKAHSRFILEIDYKNGFLISIGHDNYLCLFKFNDDKLNNEKLKKIASYKLLTTPTSIRITNYTGFPIIVLTRSESTCLFFYKLSHNDNDKENEQFKIIEIKKINLNESQYSTTNDFTPMNIKLCPINKNNDNNDLLIAVATSHVPFMRILLIKFPFLKFDEENIIEDSNLNSLNKNDNNNDDEYILGNFQTNSPQDNFSIPRITWRSDGNVSIKMKIDMNIKSKLKSKS